MKKSFTLILLHILLFSFSAGSSLLTVPEKTKFTRTSSYEEVMDFLFLLQKTNPLIHIQEIATSAEGRSIPLVIFNSNNIKSPLEMRSYNQSAVLINANIHAGEIEGKEACLMLLRDLALDRLPKESAKQVILFIPIFNPDGNEKLGKNRRDNGPELAGTRSNSQKLDLNRDFLKIESPEVRGLIKTIIEWDPLLFIDLHTTNGSYHREPVTYTTLSNPNTDRSLSTYMWQKLFPSVSHRLKTEFGFHSIPYGNFRDRSKPEKGWQNHAFAPLYSTNYVGLRNRFTILNENYAHADYKTRVYGCYSFLRSILAYTAEHITEMRQMVRISDQNTVENYRNQKFVLGYENTPLFDFTIKSYVFKKEKIPAADRHKYPSWIGDFLVKKTSRLKDYPVTYYSNPKPTDTISLPQAYVLGPTYTMAARKLLEHGITLSRTLKAFTAEAEEFVISSVKYGKNLFQGHMPVMLTGTYQFSEHTVPAGSFLIDMNQPLARLIPELLEPQASHGLLQWGFFRREIVRQWSAKPGRYPVLRLKSLHNVKQMILMQ